jgi:hypothetical protein
VLCLGINASSHTAERNGHNVVMGHSLTSQI